MYKRHIKKRILESLEEFRVVYVPGVRQAGKSTLVRQLSEETGRQYITPRVLLMPMKEKMYALTRCSIFPTSY